MFLLDFESYFTVILFYSETFLLTGNATSYLKLIWAVEIALEDITAIISSFKRLGVRNYGYLLLAKGEELEANNKLDKAKIEYKKSIKCSKKYYLYYINEYSDPDPDHNQLVQVYKEPTDHLYELYTNLGRHQEAIEIREKFFETIRPSMEMDQDVVWDLDRMKLSLAKSYMKMRRYSQAKQSLLSITHTIREETKKSLATQPLSEFRGTSGMTIWYTISVFDVLELYLQCIELKPSSKEKKLPKIAKRLFDHMEKDDFIVKNRLGVQS